jgi:hypothetical protein
VAAELLSRNQRTRLRRRKSREIAEKAVKAGEPYRDVTHVEVDAKTVKGLPQDELNRLTEEFERLGFVQMLDYRLQLKGQKDLHGFDRAMVHRELYCFGGIMATQKSLDDGKGPLLVGLDSYLEGGWRIASLNRRAYETEYFARLPKQIRLRREGATPEQLFQRHIEVRTNLTVDLGLQLLTDISLETGFRRSRETTAERKEALLECDILAELADARDVAKQEQWEWLGDYPQERVRRMKGQKLRVIPETFPVYEVPQKDALQQLEEPDVKSPADDLEH